MDDATLECLFGVVRKEYGPLSQAFVDAFKAALTAPKPTGLQEPEKFFKVVREKLFNGSLTVDQVDGINEDLKAFGAASWPIAWAAYGLATDYWETRRKMQPVEEIGRGKGRRYGKPGPHGGQIAYGRGKVQLTWPDNYAFVDKELGLGGTLIANYDRALEPEISSRILVGGMEGGWFTDRELASHLPRHGMATLAQFMEARRIINGIDKRDQIAAIARDFQNALAFGGWA